ncbi:hypothetical protein ACI3QN_12335 [Propionibacterium freudenreichii]|uniref:hypothetical protein n=1 Tax=Propionibacterium freudenreichii TaxID=1744 RepID=UPI003855317D
MAANFRFQPNTKAFTEWAQRDCDAHLIAGITASMGAKAGEGFSTMTSNNGDRTRGYLATASTKGRMRQAQGHVIERVIGSSGV